MRWRISGRTWRRFGAAAEGGVGGVRPPVPPGLPVPPGPPGPPVPPGARWPRMAARIEQALRGAGLDAAGVGRVLEAHREAGVHRAGHLPPDEDDPRWLHPGRNVIILLDDQGIVDAGVLALAAGVDQGAPELMHPGVREEAEGAGVPFLPGGLGGPDPELRAEEEWLSAAVELPGPMLALVVADALDFLRHLHLAPAGPGRAVAAGRGGRLVLPLAERLGGRLERRLRWWCSRVGAGLAGPRHFDSC